jgi:hypothetical protein
MLRILPAFLVLFLATAASAADNTVAAPATAPAPAAAAAPVAVPASVPAPAAATAPSAAPAAPATAAKPADGLIPPDIPLPSSASNTTAPAAAAEAAPAEPAKSDWETFDSPLKDPKSRDMVVMIAKGYKHYAAQIGCSKFAWGNITPDGSIFNLKFVPPNTTLSTAPMVVTVTVYGLTGNHNKDAMKISESISNIEGQYMKMGQVLDDQNYVGPTGDPVMYLYYSLGKMPQKIYGAAVYLKSSQGSAAFINLTMAGPIPPEVALKVHHIVNPLAKLPGDTSTPGKKK